MAMGTRNGTKVTIEFDVRHDQLAAPDGKHWLPCSACGHVEAVRPFVQSFYCAPCGDAHLSTLDMQSSAGFLD